jgi:acetyltransferase-like isoleucine patch superfamily enzyme
MTSESQVQTSAPSTNVHGLRRSRPSLRRHLATSESLLVRFLRWGYRGIRSFSIPAPSVLTRPLLWSVLAGREIYQFVVRVFICEPLFKGYCKKYGRGLHTDCHFHWVAGRGDIIIGDHVLLDGKISITFAARFADHPVLEIGNNTQIGHNCDFRIGKRVSIGNNCNLSGAIIVMDSNAHTVDPQPRMAGRPPDSDDVRPIVIGDGVWVGLRCIIFPGVKIGEGSVISAGSVVRTHVPPYSVAAGNPARVMFRLKKPEVGTNSEQGG